MNTNDILALRLQLLHAGYYPIPLFGKAPPQYGKNNQHKGLTGWQKITAISDEQIELWTLKIWPTALNTGALTRLMPTIDIDVLNEAAAEACKEFIRDRFEDAGHVIFRTGKPPKFAAPFRVNYDETFKKITANLIAPDGSEGEKVEFLADGQQIVVHGEHPDIKQPYRWSNGGLEQIKHEDLPYIREAEARALVEGLVEILVRNHGYTRAPGRPKDKQNGARPVPHDGGGAGDRDWGHLQQNILAGRELHDSISILAAKMIAAGMNSGASVNMLRALMDQSTASKDERWRARVSEIPAAVDSAIAKFGKTSARSSIEPEPEPESAVRAPGLAKVHDIFQGYLGKAYDTDVLDAVLATAASERLDGDPLWLLVISGPGNAKTETVQSLAGAGAIVTSTIASEGALLSATKPQGKGKSTAATGGLLRKLGNRGVVVIKDVTSILSADSNTRSRVLAAIREIYDGRWERNVGVSGGLTLTWTGRIAIIGAVTTAWDAAHSVIANMGDRFVIIRADSTIGRAGSANRAIRNTGAEIKMRATLAKTAGRLISNASKDGYQLTDDEIDQLVKAADIVTSARTAVERDYRGEIIDAHAPEMPTRFAKQLTQLIRGAVAIGIPAQDAMRLAIRCARDSIPPLRREILLDIVANPASEPHEVHRRIGRPRNTVRRELEALYMLRLLQCEETDETDKKGKVVRTVYEYSLADEFDAATLLAMTRG
jgi:hypothetical protein